MKIVLGLSGGVDSAVSARLLQEQGYDVYGLYLDQSDENARNDAIRTAEFLNVPLEIRNITEELEKLVCRPFTESYLCGETPNPCILCNPTLKFRSLLEYADEIGAPCVATGHYARTENGCLYKGMPSNDQSYMLCRLSREQVSRLVLPLGGYEKTEIRALAEKYEIPVAKKPDSMEICFVPDKNYIEWLGKRTELPGQGNMVFQGNIIGTHTGIYRWTVGQRIPGLYNERKLYVKAIHAGINEIELGLWEELFETRIEAQNAVWLIEKPESPFRASVKVRHTKWECPECTVTPTENGFIAVTDSPLRAPAPGQSAVLYIGDRLIGSGFLKSSG